MKTRGAMREWTIEKRMMGKKVYEKSTDCCIHFVCIMILQSGKNLFYCNGWLKSNYDFFLYAFFLALLLGCNVVSKQQADL